jgi:soluble lytic murein transglycosylase
MPERARLGWVGVALGVLALECAPLARPAAGVAVASAAPPPLATVVEPAAPPIAEPTFDPRAVELVLDAPALAAAKAALAAGNPGRAAALVQEAHANAKEPSRSELAFQLARLRGQSGDPLGAARAYDDVEESHALRPHARFLAGQVLLEAGKAADAVARLREASTAEFGAATDARAALAEALAKAGSFEEAKSTWLALLEQEDRAGRDASLVRVSFVKALLAHPTDAHAALAVAHARAAERKPSVAAEARALEARALATLPFDERKRLGTQSDAEVVAKARSLANKKKPRDAQEGLKLVAPLVASPAAPIACEALRAKGELLHAVGRRSEAALTLDAAFSKCKGMEAEPAALFAAGRALASVGLFAHAETRLSDLEARFSSHRLADNARGLRARTARSAGDAAKADALVLSMPDAYPTGDTVGDALFEHALALVEQGAYEKASVALAKGAGLPRKERAYSVSGRFSYWLGRAKLALGDRRAAKEAFARAISEHPLSVYMALSYSRLRELDEPEAARALAQAQERDRADPFVLRRVPEMDSPAFQRALELVRQGDAKLAKREFDSLGVSARTAPREVAYAAALLLARVGTREPTAILQAATLPGAKSDAADWLDHYPEGAWRAAWEAAYPRPFRDVVQAQAAAARLPESLVYAVMREESAFDPRAVSPAKAYGLMQLIVPTAKSMAAPLGLKVDARALQQPEVNITLGCRFLGFLRGRFADDVLLAIPAYNAGPGAPAKWLDRQPARELDLFVERIPYEETNLYTKRVLTSQLAYEALYGSLDASEPLRLPQLASPARAAASRASK